MKITIFGMGYVGITSAACLLEDGHDITGVDINKIKVKYLRQKKYSFIKEKGIPKRLSNGYENKKLNITSNAVEGIIGSDMIWICVGTPSKYDGSVDTSYVETVIKEIGEILKKVNDRPLIVVRSTCLPGTIENKIIPILEETTGLKVGKDINVVFHPEFLREGTSIEDFKYPSRIVVGGFCDNAMNFLLSIYKDYDTLFFKLSYKEAEMVKYCDNIFHAFKITFANEMATISNSFGIDSRKIAKVYCSDKKLNISSLYLCPGFAYGGSCLPKDTRAILNYANSNFIKLPMLEGIVESNQVQINNFISRILKYKPFRIGIIGLSFKSGTDDIRESPYVKVAKSFIGEGIELKIYDPLICQNNLIGSNKKQFQQSFRNMDNFLISSLEEILSSDIIIINHPIVNTEQIKLWLEKGIKIIDVANVADIDHDGYEGIYWK